ncbi:MAG: site-2 protease family protein [Steroidobacteraceae bacterium]
MANVVPPGAAPPNDILYRCVQCGIESKEASCFVGIAVKGPQCYPVKCITCTKPVESGGHLRQFFGIFGVFFMPLLFLVAVRGSSSVVTAALLLAAAVIQPMLVILHELGHFLTARLLGLEPSLISLGVGPKLWGGKILGVPWRIHGWPTSGLTYVGSRSIRFLRLRVWLTVLMGPVTNILLIGVAVVFWDSLTRSFGANLVLLWIIFNAFLVLTNVLPFRFRRLGQMHRSDGLQLLQIPFKTRAELAAYLSATPILTALELFKESDYAGCRAVCLKGLERLPGNPSLSIMLSACQINVGEYDAARLILEPLVNTSVAQTPETYAIIYNNLALATWLGDINAPLSEQSTQLADGLSHRAYTMYPCVLPYRSTRALLLVATNHPEEALALLEYSNYEPASASDRGDQQIARAVALRRINRNEEADHALSAGLQLNKAPRPWLTTMLAPNDARAFASLAESANERRY